MKSYRVASITVLILVVLVPGSPGVGPLQYYTVTPCRLVDTRDLVGPSGGPILAANTVRNFPVYGSNARACGLPATLGQVKAVSLNVAVINPISATGFLVAYKKGLPVPSTANINFNAGEPALANGAIVELATNDANYQMSVYPANASTNLVIDVTGYYQ